MMASKARKSIKISNKNITSTEQLKLIEFPEEVKTLDIGNNQLKSIGKEINRFKYLKTLSLRNNNIKDFPTQILELNYLEKLILGGNQINEIPEDIFKIQSLKELHLSKNRIRTLPEGLFQLKKLKTLWVSGNNLLEIPPLIENLSDLEKIYLSFNQIDSIPKQIMGLKKLRGIFLEGNPLRSIPIYNWKGNKLKEVKAYIDSIDKEVKNIFKAKILILGDGAVGKTTLINRIILTDEEFERKKLKITETKGVKIFKLPKRKVKFKKETYDLDVNVWDFGGQEIQREIHQLFLSNESLYLLLWSNRTIHSKYQYLKKWLNKIETFGGDKSRVILVQTMYGEKEVSYSSINREDLQIQFPEILYKFANVSSYENIGIFNRGGLNDLMIEELKELPHVGKVISANWFSVEKNIIQERIKNKYISIKKFKEICETHDIDQDEIVILLGWLNNIGSVLYFERHRNLRNYIFLDSQWLTKKVYDILLDDNKVIEKNFGRFSFNELSDPFDEDVSIIIDIMEKFDLCFSIDDKKENYIIPSLLPDKMESSIKESFKSRDLIKYEYQYELYPASLISRFISRAYKENLVFKKEYWRQGVILMKEKSFARVAYDTKTKQLQDRVIIEVVGNKRWYLLERIQDIFKIINSSAKVLNEFHYCTNVSNCKDPFSFKFKSNLLKKAFNRKVESIQCLNCFKIISLTNFFLNAEKVNHFLIKSLREKIIEGDLKEVYLQIVRQAESINEKGLIDSAFLNLSRWADLEKSSLNGIISREDYHYEFSILRSNALKLLERLENNR